MEEEEELQQMGRARNMEYDDEVSDDLESRDGSAAGGDASTEASYNSRPGSRASSTEELKQKIDQLERKQRGQPDLPTVQEGAEQEMAEQQQEEQRQGAQEAERRQQHPYNL